MNSFLALIWRKRPLILSAIIVLFLTLAIYTAQSDRRTFRVLSSLGIHHGWTNSRSFFPPLKDGCPADDIPLPPIIFPTDSFLGDVQIVMKTGIGEKSKTKAFLDTYGSVISNVLIISDAEYEVGGHKTIDILAELPESYAFNNSDWQAYIDQNEALSAGQEVSKSHGGWKLDRFKFLPMVEKASQMAPHAKWYVFIEADMYYFWDTLIRMLETLDPEQPHYLGAPTPGSYGRWFAYGGGGTVLSNRLVRDLLKEGKNKVSSVPKYEVWAKDDCCGDAVLAYVIHAELDIRLESMYPTISGEDVRWLATTKEKWCTPLLGLHRAGEELMRRLWRWERCRPYTETPITYATILDFVLSPVVKEKPKAGWNNGAKNELPEESLAHDGPRFCEIACADSSTCLQWRYVNGWCNFADFVMTGDEEREKEKESVSGWNLDTLEKLGYVPGKDPSTYCKEAQWLIPQVMT